MEIRVKQRTGPWFDARKEVALSSSVFGDAIGVGAGKPFDFFKHILFDSTEDGGTEKPNVAMQHGIDMEPAIVEAYHLLTGNKTRESGFWRLRDCSDPLYNLIGASPDGIVVDQHGNAIGLCEAKAPVFSIYSGQNCPNRIPRKYMAQMQGQMAVTGFPWCDFIVICCKTKEILLKKVYFQPMYWKHISGLLMNFCTALKEAKYRQVESVDQLDFPSVNRIKSLPMVKSWFTGEGLIRVENQLTMNSKKQFQGPSKNWFSFDFLLGTSFELPEELENYRETILAVVDKYGQDQT